MKEGGKGILLLSHFTGAPSAVAGVDGNGTGITAGPLPSSTRTDRTDGRINETPIKSMATAGAKCGALRHVKKVTVPHAQSFKPPQSESVQFRG